MPKTTNKKTPSLDRQLELLAMLADSKISNHRIAVSSFIRGLFLGFGTVLGGTVLVGLLAWILSLFDSFPLLGDIVKAITTTLSR